MITLYNSFARADSRFIEYINSKYYTYSGNKYSRQIHLEKRHHIPAETARSICNNLQLLDAVSDSYLDCKVCNDRRYLTEYNHVPIGLLDVTPTSIIDEYGVEDRRVRPIGNSIPIALELYDYQQKIADTAINIGRGIIQAPTGSGKTELAVYITAMLGLKTLIVVPTIVILGQFIERFNKYGIEVGQLGGGKRNIKDVTISVVNSVCDGSKDALSALNCDVLILDEHHRYAAQDWYPVLLGCDAYYRFGQSATPIRDNEFDTMKLIALCGRYIGSISVNELQDKGKLSDAVVSIISIGGNDRFDFGNNWMRTYKTGIVHNQTRNELIAKIAKETEQHKVLILVSWDEHAQELLKLMPDAAYLCGGKTIKQVEKIKTDFIQNKKIMIATTTGDVGLDIPCIDMLIVAGGGKSDVRTKQRAGRSLRTFSGSDSIEPKQCAEIIDFDDRQNGILQYHSSKRIQSYKNVGLRIKFLDESDV